MTDNVLEFDGITKAASNPDSVLKSAIGELSEVTIVGTDKDGNEYFASSISDGGHIIWQMERFKLQLLTIDDEA